MKKILAFTLAGLMALGGAAVFTACKDDPSPVLYLVPGTYVQEGAQVENTISGTGTGATKLTKTECEAIHTDNVYLCSLETGATLPTPSSGREDKDGTPYVFNGWWTIVDATVTYFDKMPELTETVYLYADWRADLSQRKDPVVPDPSTAVQTSYYMSIVRANPEEAEEAEEAEDTEETEEPENTEIIVPLYISGTDISNAFDFGYGKPVQLYNSWFELCPGDRITVYTTGLGEDPDENAAPQLSPIAVDGKSPSITLEYSSAEDNDTRDYLSVVSGSTTITYKAETSRHFRIYIKFYDKGASMAVYMQPKD